MIDLSKFKILKKNIQKKFPGAGSKKKEILIHVLIIPGLKDEQKEKIKNLILGSIKGVKDCFLTPASKVSDIVVEAKWPADMVEKELDRIRRLWGVSRIQPYFIRSESNNVL